MFFNFNVLLEETIYLRQMIDLVNLNLFMTNQSKININYVFCKLLIKFLLILQSQVVNALEFLFIHYRQPPATAWHLPLQGHLVRS